jgi:hypothetical protein
MERFVRMLRPARPSREVHITEHTQISALTNCGGFPDVFQNHELNRFGLIEDFDRVSEIRRQLAEHHPEEPHANCELYAVWRLEEA